jgi:hypothetical protein
MTRTLETIAREREYRLEQIDLWRSGAKARASFVLSGPEAYALEMRETIKHHDKALAELKAEEEALLAAAR